ncbi:unnamed protein product [Rodentolepis nana]|uniref:FYVE_2 domain-containing protein n=1 Tax=Rodentolepis nana TaxID=102285 RepID=A0A0R3TF20_RODNA|nr:unnamed protein product [Rodentolepis nana]
MIADILKGELEESNSESDTSSVGSESSSQRIRNCYRYNRKDNCLTCQICARCLSPILGPRRKSKICELCTAKMTFGISNEFSDQRLDNGKPTETTFDKDYWRMLKKPVVFLPKTRNAKTILTNEKRLWSLVTTNSVCLPNPPPNVFPFGDGVVNADVPVNEYAKFCK